MLSIQEIRTIGEKEWQAEYKKAHEELIKLRLQIISGYSKATDKLKKLRKYIARLLTVKRELSPKGK